MQRSRIWNGGKSQASVFLPGRTRWKPDVLSLLKQSGVTAIELGAQSMDDRVLLQNGRGHTAREVESAARRIREMGFELGLQMMTGLPGDTPAGAENTLCQLLSLEPDTMRIYPTIVLEGTLLAKQYLSGTYLPQLLGRSGFSLRLASSAV